MLVRKNKLRNNRKRWLPGIRARVMPVIQTIIIEDEAAFGVNARWLFKGAAISINLSTDMNDKISTDTLTKKRSNTKTYIE